MNSISKSFWTVQDLLTLGADLKMDATKINASLTFTKVVAAEADAADGLAIVSSPEQIKLALRYPKAILVVPLQAMEHPLLKPDLERCLGCENPGILWGRALENFHPNGRELKPEKMHHASAVIHPTAKIHEGAIIEAYAVIGAHTEIKKGAWIGSHCVIDDHVSIGEGTRLQAHVYIGPRTQIGARVVIKPSTVIGSAGFGFSHDANGHHFAIPQVGKVIIEDDVFIGSLCNVDRATTTDTVIGKGTKIDSMVHIAHNCKIGEHTILTGSVAIAGSSTVGDHCLFGGRTTVTDHVHICDKVQLAGLSAVTKDIKEAGAYGGFPLQKIREALKSTASIAHLPQLRKDIARLLKNAGLKENT